MTYLISSAQGSSVVSGDIEAWLSDRKAKPRKAGGYLIGGRVVMVQPLSDETVRIVARIIPNSACARILEHELERRR